MNSEIIDNVLESGEGINVEFKSALNSVPSSFYETVVSFSNTDGGTIYLGISDDHEIDGVAPDSANRMLKNIVSALNSTDCINPPVYVQPILITYKGKYIIAIQIQSSSQVHEYRRRIYIREFESDIDVTENNSKISELYARKRTYFSETQIYSKLKIEDLETSLFQKARDIIRGYRSDHPWVMVSNEQLLRESVLWRRDFQTGEEGLTLAAALIFGKDETIQSILPAYKIEAMVRRENSDSWDDRIDPPLRTNLIDTYLKLKEFISKHLPAKFYTYNGQRVDLRDRIFREVIGNLIVHREYTSALSSELIIYNDEVITTNPNRAQFHGLIDLNSFNPFPKNPNIRKFFNSFGWTDEIGSGIRNTAKYLPLYVSGASPLFIEDDVFRTIIPLQSFNLADFSENFLLWLELNQEILPHLKKGLENIAVKIKFKGKTWQDILILLVPSWNQKGINLLGMDWPEKQALKEEEIKKVQSWDMKSTNLLHKKVRIIISILCLCSEPLSLEMLMKSIDYKNRKTFRENYLKPLEKTKLIRKTNPQNPNSPNQKYIITEKGKLFLGDTEI